MPQYLVLHELSEVREARFIEANDDDLPDRCYRLDGKIHELHGGQHPTLFRTLKMATKAKRDGHTYVRRDEIDERFRPPGGKILLFEPALLRELAPDQTLDHPGLADRLTELEVAERQMQLWADRAAHLRIRIAR
jgi:hypothetical protein